MYERDYLLNEARKFAQLLAKLMGLKAEGTYDNYLQQFNQVLESEYNTELETLLGLTEDSFKQHLLQADYSTEKLNALGQMLYVFAEPFEPTDETILIFKKVLLVFDVLQEKHHFESFENIDKRNTIYRFFNNNYEQS